MNNKQKEQLKSVKEMINAVYDSKICGWTSDRSRGNSDDVFDDGVSVGYNEALYEIGTMLGLNLPEPVEPIGWENLT